MASRKPKFATRDEWLMALDGHIAKLLAEKAGVKKLPKARISVGFTSHGNKVNGIMGECWSDSASKDKHFEIFVDPQCDDALEVANTVVHERIHSVLGVKEGHGKKFTAMALKCGMTLPATATPSGPDFVRWFREVRKDIGAYPHAALNTMAPMFYKPQVHDKLVNVRCPICDYFAKIRKSDAEDPTIKRIECPHDHGPLLRKGEDSSEVRAAARKGA